MAQGHGELSDFIATKRNFAKWTEDECTRATISTLLAWVRHDCLNHESGTIQVKRSNRFNFAYVGSIDTDIMVFWPKDNRFKHTIVTAVRDALRIVGANFVEDSESEEQTTFDYDFDETTNSCGLIKKPCAVGDCFETTHSDTTLCKKHYDRAVY